MLTKRSSITFERCAVVTWVIPLANGPSSRSTTCLPALASRYAVVSPAIPAPTTHTSQSKSAANRRDFGSLTVAPQIDSLCAAIIGETRSMIGPPTPGAVTSHRSESCKPRAILAFLQPRRKKSGPSRSLDRYISVANQVEFGRDDASRWVGRWHAVRLETHRFPLAGRASSRIG